MNNKLIKSRINEVANISQEVLGVITPCLNLIHKTNNDKKHWNIILGHWLQRYIGFLYYIYHDIDIKKYKIDDFCKINYDGLIKKDSYSFITETNNLKYQLQIIGLLDLYKNNEIFPKIESISDANIARGKENKGKKNLKNFINNILIKFYSKDEFVIINTYLPKKLEFRLQISLRQIPKFWKFPNSIKEQKINSELRSIFTKFELYDNSLSFFNFCIKLIPYSIPKSYMEGYEELENYARDVKMPKFPRVIFTSNNYDTDEFFKVWVVEKIKQGSKYLVGQHGSNYGTHLYYGNGSWPERSAVDAFITWGWSNNDIEIPAYNFKVPYQQRKYTKPLPGILVITQPKDFQTVPWNTQIKYDNYLDDLHKLVIDLSDFSLAKINLRFHKESSEDFNKDNLNKFFSIKNVICDFQRQDLLKVKSTSKIIIYTYDSTGILESLNYDEPFICYFNEGINHVDHSVIDYYQKLIDAKIIHVNHEKCVEFIREIWDNIDEWWNCELTLKAKIEFKDQFSRSTKSPINDLINIFKRF